MAFSGNVNAFADFVNGAQKPGVQYGFLLFKSIPLPREGWSVQLRFEAFNVFNVQNWDMPSGTTISSGITINANAGQITGLAGGTSPRQLQFGLRFQF